MSLHTTSANSDSGREGKSILLKRNKSWLFIWNNIMRNAYLVQNNIRFRSKRGSFEFSTSNNLRFHNSFFLSYHSFCHVFFLQQWQFWFIWTFSYFLDYVLLPLFLLFSELSRHELLIIHLSKLFIFKNLKFQFSF